MSSSLIDDASGTSEIGICSQHLFRVLTQAQPAQPPMPPPEKPSRRPLRTPARKPVPARKIEPDEPLQPPAPWRLPTDCPPAWLPGSRPSPVSWPPMPPERLLSPWVLSLTPCLFPALIACSLLGDGDHDGYPAPADCQDTNTSVHPGAAEVPYNGIDEDCDGQDLLDVDTDGYAAAMVGGSDCDDENAQVHPGAPEICDGLANACDGFVDDADHDGHKAQACLSEALFGDCDDGDASVYPHATEQPYDGIDQDCIAGDLVDVDWDGVTAIEAGGTDCDDQDAAVGPETERLIPGGRFLYSPPTATEAPAAPTLPRDVPRFCIDRGEVTINDYKRCEALLLCEPPAGTEADPTLNQWYRTVGNSQLPVVGVTPAQAQGYCQSLGKTLPSLEQWQKSARGGLCLTEAGVGTFADCPTEALNPAPARIWPWGDLQPDCTLANFTPDSGETCVGTTNGPPLLAVDELPLGASPYGVSQLGGNAAEWVQVGTGPGEGYGALGGSFSSGPDAVRIDTAVPGWRNTWSTTTGFRCVRTLPVPPAQQEFVGP